MVIYLLFIMEGSLFVCYIEMSQKQYLAPCTTLGTIRKPSIDEEGSTRVFLMFRPMMQELLIIDKFCPKKIMQIGVSFGVSFRYYFQSP
jgi:hypothetical protein